MLKKLLLAFAFLTTLLLPVMPGRVLAVDVGTPSGDLKSTEFMFDLGVITHKEIPQANWVEKGINYFAGRIIGLGAGLAGSIAVLMMGIGGLLMITSAGDQGKYDKGKSMMKFAALGLVFVFGAYILVTTIQVLIKSIYAS